MGDAFRYDGEVLWLDGKPRQGFKVFAFDEPDGRHLRKALMFMENRWAFGIGWGDGEAIYEAEGWGLKLQEDAFKFSDEPIAVEVAIIDTTKLDDPDSTQIWGLVPAEDLPGMIEIVASWPTGEYREQEIIEHGRQSFKREAERRGLTEEQMLEMRSVEFKRLPHIRDGLGLA